MVAIKNSNISLHQNSIFIKFLKILKIHEIFCENPRIIFVLFYDIARQMRTPAAIASVDASNCYDRIAHAMASLIFQSFGVESTAVSAMLETIQEMPGLKSHQNLC